MSILTDGFRFALVGVSATAIHMCVALLVLALGLAPLLSNAIGFGTALGFAAVAHHIFSFPGRVPFRVGAARYVPAALLGFLANTAILATLDRIALAIPSWARLVISVLAIPTATFLYARHFAYRPRND